MNQETKKFIQSFRTWMIAKISLVLSLSIIVPEQVKTVIGVFASPEWVETNWKVVIAIVTILGALGFEYGKRNKGTGKKIIDAVAGG